MLDNKNIFVLDTNVLIHDPESIFSFDDAVVAIPIIVLEELDKFKSESGERGRNSRQAIRHLDALRNRGSLAEGVALDNGSLLKVVFDQPQQKCPALLKEDIKDNKILHIAFCLKQEGYNVKFITQDLNARIKADAIGLESIDYLKDLVNSDQPYTGWFAIQAPSVNLKKDIPEELSSLIGQYDFTPNEFIIVESKNNPENYVVYRYISNNKFRRVDLPYIKWPLSARNPQQLMALDLLFDPSVQLVSLIGAAGTGKTFLALLAGLHQVLVEEEYEKILVSRPVIPLGPDIGYLPGDIQEKLHSWMQPVHDNMEFIIHSANASYDMGIYRDAEYGSLKGKARKYKNKKFAQNKDKRMPSLEELIKQHKISLEAITYMRGRSIPYQFIIIDEVQNLTPHEIKTIISRAGEGSKIILCGDPYQIDSPYLDFNTNGLMVATSKFKGQPIFGTVFLETSERSELSRLAGELL